eukprot:scaffold4.g4568.t1
MQAALSASRAVFAPRQAGRVQARRSVVVNAVSRPLWQPGSTPPAHLDGSLPGDLGFDPLNLGANKAALDWYRHAEIYHCRTAMTAVAGILIPSILTKWGILNVPEWYDAGKAYYEGANPIPFNTLLAIQFLLYNFVEIKRLEDIKKPGSQAEPGSFLGFEGSFKGTGVHGYPGGPFDPLGLSKGSAQSVKFYKDAELKNGRIAMLALLGFAAQHGATSKGPVDNLLEHIANPWGVNFASNGVSLPVSIF